MILITGASGFIGRTLCPLLQKRNIKAVIRDGSPSELSSQTFGIRDITSQEEWRSLVKDVDSVVHLAARAHILADSEEDPLAAFRKVNVEGSVALAKEAMLAGVKRFVYLSSIGVHGNFTSDAPLSEESDINPHDLYAISKAEAELALRELTKDSDMELVIIRPVLVYGAGAPGNIARLLRIASSGIPLPLAQVNNRRSLVSVWNLCNFIELCITHPNAANEAFIIADDHYISTPQILNCLSEGMGKKARLFSVPPSLLKCSATLFGKKREFEKLCGSLEVDTHKAKSLLGWKCLHSIQEGLVKTGKSYYRMQ